MNKLADLPPCIRKCDVCGAEPIDSWSKGFGCNVCKGWREMLIRNGLDPDGKHRDLLEEKLKGAS